MPTSVPIRVLCVEDNKYVADAIERKLCDDDRFEYVGWASNRNQVESALGNNPPAVVCLDYNIPGLDTIDLIKLIGLRSPGTRVMMLSGDSRESVVDQAVKAGAWGYLSKAECSADIVSAIWRVAHGEFVLSSHVLATAPPKEPTKPSGKGFMSWWSRNK